jgi:putative tryptophan/tyrosine transport system substrate-binding protein
MSARGPEDSAYLLGAFHRGLAEGGFVEGQNVAIEFRWAHGQYDRLPAIATDLARRGVNVITAVGGDPSPLAAKRATSTIPIVFGMGSDPVSAGLVQSFNRPGGNVTGITLLTNEMEPKRLGLLRELAPGAALIGILLNPSFPPAALQLQQIEEAARGIGQRIAVARASTDEELDTAFAAWLRSTSMRCWSQTCSASGLSLSPRDSVCPPSIISENLLWPVDC